MKELLDAIVGGVKQNVASKLETVKSIDLADIIWQTVDPVGYNAMLVQDVKMKNPRIGQPDVVPNLEDRLFYQATLYIDALFKRDQEFRANANWNQGRMSREDLNRATDAARTQREADLLRKKKTPL